MSTRTRAVVRIAVAVAVIGAIVWYLRSRGEGSSSSSAATGSGSGDRVVAVQVAPVQVQDLPIWLEGLGSVAPFQQVTVRPQVDGRLDKVLFTEGQNIKKGDPLAEIDPRPWQVQLHQAQGALARDRAQLDAARRNYERYKGLREQNLVAQQQVDEYAAQVGQFEGAIKVDAAAIENAQLLLDYTMVRSPIDGVTGVRQVDAGNLVKASDPNGLVVIASIDPVAILFTVPQDKLAGVTSAMARAAEAHTTVDVEVWNRDDTQKLAVGKLAVLDNQINQTTATLRLKAVADNPQRLLWPNAFVKARMLLETRKGAIVIPAVAVQRGPQGTFVYVVGADKVANLRPVTVALLAGDRAAIEKGLQPGEQVIVEGQNQIRPGGRVETGAGKDKGGKDGSGGKGGKGGKDGKGVVTGGGGAAPGMSGSGSGGQTPSSGPFGASGAGGPGAGASGAGSGGAGAGGTGTSGPAGASGASGAAGAPGASGAAGAPGAPAPANTPGTSRPPTGSSGPSSSAPAGSTGPSSPAPGTTPPTTAPTTPTRSSTPATPSTTPTTPSPSATPAPTTPSTTPPTPSTTPGPTTPTTPRGTSPATRPAGSP